MQICARRRHPRLRSQLLAGVALWLWAAVTPALAADWYSAPGDAYPAPGDGYVVSDGYAGPRDGYIAPGDGSGTNNPDLLTPPPHLLDARPYEWNDPFFDLDWSLALRGAYVTGESGVRYEGLAVPSVTLTRETLRGGYELSGSAEITTTSLDPFRLGALRASAAADYQIDALTAWTGNLELSLTQDGPGDPAVPTDIASAPLIGSAEAETAVTRELGMFDVTLRGTGSRTVYGTTTLNDGTVLDNGAQNNWTAGAGLRLGYRVTPILTAFVDGSAGYQYYDLPSPIYLAKLDAADYALRTGLSASWSSVLEAEASVGLGLRRFADPGFSDVISTLYDASLTFRPDETLTLTGSLSTSVGAPGPDSSGLARIAYEAAASANYLVNPWLGLRGSAGWNYATLAGTSDSETGLDAGIGLDYLVNQFATISADYAFSWAAENAGPGEVEHRVTLGVTFARPREPDLPQ